VLVQWRGSSRGGMACLAMGDSSPASPAMAAQWDPAARGPQAPFAESNEWKGRCNVGAPAARRRGCCPRARRGTPRRWLLPGRAQAAGSCRGRSLKVGEAGFAFPGGVAIMSFAGRTRAFQVVESKRRSIKSGEPPAVFPRRAERFCCQRKPQGAFAFSSKNPVRPRTRSPGSWCCSESARRDPGTDLPVPTLPVGEEPCPERCRRPGSCWLRELEEQSRVCGARSVSGSKDFSKNSNCLSC